MRITLIMFIVLLSSCFQSPKPEIFIPHAGRDESFTRFANPLTDKYGLERLRETRLAKGDLEIRVWLITHDTDTFILKRADDEWSATALKEIDCRKFNYFPKDKPYELGKMNLGAPKSGWENVWKNLSETGILDLPEPPETYFLHGINYYVEINHNGIYRTYYYSNPDLQKSDEAQRMVKIAEIIADEFGLHNFKFGSLCLEK